MWLLTAVLSAVFAALTSILAKCGIHKTDSDVATALRTIVVLLFSWVMVFIVGSQDTLRQISPGSLVFLVLSGLATGASWICYFKALAMGDINRVVPIDKSSTILSVLLAIVLFHETNNLPVKLIGIVLIGTGILLMVEKKQSRHKQENRRWILYAVLSAVFAALTSILAKLGISGVESNLATAVRTCVVLIMAWVCVFLQGKQKKLRSLDLRELGFIALSGIATGASWLCYYHAIQHGMVSVVIPIDKASIALTVLFSWLVFHEKLSRKSGLGLGMMLAGTLAMALWA